VRRGDDGEVGDVGGARGEGGDECFADCGGRHFEVGEGCCGWMRCYGAMLWCCGVVVLWCGVVVVYIQGLVTWELKV